MHRPPTTTTAVNTAQGQGVAYPPQGQGYPPQGAYPPQQAYPPQVAYVTLLNLDRLCYLEPGLVGALKLT